MWDFNIPLTAKDRLSDRKSIRKQQALLDPSDQMDIIDIYRIFHPKAAEYTFFLSTQRTFSC